MNRYIIALFPAFALAEGVPPKPAPVPVTVSESVSAAVAGAGASATASPVVNVSADPTASSLSTQTQSASSSTTNANTVSAASDSGGNTQQTSFRAPQNAPAVATAPATIVGCGASASGGGSNTGGAAVLGLSWVTVQCYDFMLAQAYQAAGAYAASCEVLNRSKAGRRARKRGVTLPDCAPAADVVRLIDPPDLSSYVKREELREVADRITRQMVSK